MDSSILNIESAVEFLGVSEKTLIKLLREEHIPARKIGREWRFNKEALLQWLSTGDSIDYVNQADIINISRDDKGTSTDLLDGICQEIAKLKEDNNINEVVKVGEEIGIPETATKRVTYKQSRDIEKIRFELFWPIRNEFRAAHQQDQNL